MREAFLECQLVGDSFSRSYQEMQKHLPIVEREIKNAPIPNSRTLTVVYSIPQGFSVGTIMDHPHLTAASWSHTLDERDNLKSKMTDVQAELDQVTEELRCMNENYQALVKHTNSIKHQLSELHLSSTSLRLKRAEGALHQAGYAVDHDGVWQPNLGTDRPEHPAVRLHITKTDTHPNVEVEILDGTHLQPDNSPVDLYVKAIVK